MTKLYNVPQTRGLEQQEGKLTPMDPGAAPSLAEESGPSPEYAMIIIKTNAKSESCYDSKFHHRKN